MAYGAPVGKCQKCGKQSFISKKAAKTYMRNAFHKERMSVYRCGAYYHFGHTPTMVKKGQLDRRDLKTRRQ